MKHVYEFDSAGDDLVTITSSIINADGTEHMLLKDIHARGADFTPKTSNTVLTSFLTGNKPRKIQATFNSGSDQAVTREFYLPIDAGFYVFSNDAYHDVIYSDEACTIPIENVDRKSDLAFYVK